MFLAFGGTSLSPLYYRAGACAKRTSSLAMIDSLDHRRETRRWFCPRIVSDLTERFFLPGGEQFVHSFALVVNLSRKMSTFSGKERIQGPKSCFPVKKVVFGGFWGGL